MEGKLLSFFLPTARIVRFSSFVEDVAREFRVTSVAAETKANSLALHVSVELRPERISEFVRKAKKLAKARALRLAAISARGTPRKVTVTLSFEER